ncbi:MAG: helix-turn-helix transcriptional regulator [Sterolibacterium sp.]
MNQKQDIHDLQATLARQIRALRVERGISQETLALAADVDRTYISQLERGIANPSLLILWRIAEALEAELNLALMKKDSE